MKRWSWIVLAWFAIAAALGATTLSFGAVVTQKGDEVEVSGLLRDGDLKTLDFSKVKRVVFHDSLGGTVEGVSHYVEFIEKNELPTLVRGKCYSACAIAFLAGKTRNIQSRWVASALVFHVARNQTKSAVSEYKDNDRVIALIDRLTEGKLTPDVRAKIRGAWRAESGVAFVVLPGIFGPRFKTLYCNGDQGYDTSKCEELRNADPRSLGILKPEGR